MKYKESKNIWLDRLNVLSKFVDEIESKQVAVHMSRSTMYYIEKLTRLGTFDGKQISFYSKNNIYLYIKHWFKTYCAIMDEMMVIYTGVCYRQYHQKLHEKYIHLRSDNKSVYKTDHPLTYCSIDGIDYEYNQLIKKFNQYSVSITLYTLMMMMIMMILIVTKIKIMMMILMVMNLLIMMMIHDGIDENGINDDDYSDDDNDDQTC